MSNNLAGFVWSIADQLRGVYKPNKYGDVILPMTILRRMECVLEPHRDLIAGLAATTPPEVLELLVRQDTGLTFYNTSPYSLAKILEEPENLRGNLKAYLDGFSGNVADLFTHYKFDVEIDTLDTKGLPMNKHSIRDRVGDDVLHGCGRGGDVAGEVRCGAAASG